METFNTYQIMKGVAERSLANQKRGPSDFERDGILFCGVCKEPRQMWVEYPNPCDEDPSRYTPLFTACQCKCERDAEEAEKRAEAEKKAREEWVRRNSDTVAALVGVDIKGEKFGPVTFEDFQLTKNNEKNLSLCRRYVSKFDLMIEKNQGLLLWGGVGTGKSFAAACIANELLKKEYAVSMTSFGKLIDCFSMDKDAESGILKMLDRTQLLILDDLGAERDTPYGMEKVYNVIDGRYRRKKPMILTTNLGIEQMKNERDPRYSRIYDRIFECCYPVPFTGPSWRRKEAGRRFSEMDKLLNEE